MLIRLAEVTQALEPYVPTMTISGVVLMLVGVVGGRILGR